MMEYKVCFHISYYQIHNGSVWKYNGKMHYAGRTLEEAVEKIRGHVASVVLRGGKCTSFTIQRGREKGRNVKWDEYHKKGDLKRLWENSLAKETAYRRPRVGVD